MPHASFYEPVAGLLTFGKLDYRHRNDPWPDYLALGITAEQVPDLVRMAADPELNRARGVKAWAPIHAVRTLGQLRAAETAPDLVRLLDEFEEDDWFGMELRKVFAMMGPDTVPSLIDFLGDRSVSELGRMAVPECLESVARDHPETWNECVAALTRQLEEPEHNGRGLNGLIIWTLIEMRAVESLDAIRNAFAQDQVELQIVGDLEDVEIAMGVRERRSTPPPRLNRFGKRGSDLDGRDFGEDENGDGPRWTSVLDTGLPVRRLKIGRNEPCPCGSGRKFKKCCLN